jgi:hypothetical protein
MNDTIIQATLWITAGGLMMLFLRRRRGRKSSR